MWPFKKKERVKTRVLVFDMDKIEKLESLTPDEIISLVCAAVPTKPETAVIYHPELWHGSLSRITKEAWV